MEVYRLVKKSNKVSDQKFSGFFLFWTEIELENRNLKAGTETENELVWQKFKLKRTDQSEAAVSSQSDRAAL